MNSPRASTGGPQRSTPSVNPRNGRYLKIAHRGASAYSPENTLRAYGLALDMGADMNEVDIHLSADGHPVLSHDASLDRRGVGLGRIERHTQAEIRRAAGEGPAGIPTLQEAIAVSRGRGGLYIEMKGAGCEPVVCDLLRKNEFTHRAIVGSFDEAKVRRVRELDPDLETALLIAANVNDWPDRCRRAGARYVHFCWEAQPQPHRLLDEGLFDRARADGLRVIAWHEERGEVLRALKALPVAGICGNCPDLL